MVDVSDLNPAQVLAALYNNAKTQGLGFLDFEKEPMSVEQAQEILDSSNDKYFDYLKGRVMKIRIEKSLDTALYNRDNGEGAAERVIENLRKQS